MARQRWKLTQKVIDGADPEIGLDEWGDGVPVFGLKVIDLLGELARDPANGLREIAPGVYQGPKVP
jgi:hypothetical protein